MSYNSRDLGTLTTQFLNGNFNKSELEQKILAINHPGEDYIVDSPKSQKVKPKNYRIEDQGDKLVMLNKNEETVAVLEYYFDSSGTLYLPWGESYEKGKGHMSALFAEAKDLAKNRGVKIIMFEIDEKNEKMQEIAYHWEFEKGDRVRNSNNTESYFYYCNLK